jgi:solute carrier family 35 (UDP-xylose/UDP-N-acetylglucosamine transporter), member B4
MSPLNVYDPNLDFCISGVHKLSSIATSVTLNLVLTIRKFISLVVSVIVFKNPFLFGNWVGSVCVFIGTVVYSIPDQTVETNVEKSNKNKKE